jgi:hypothetical protein
MGLMLHIPDERGELRSFYRRAFEEAVELFIVSAYLTAWDDELTINPECYQFRIIIGKDFGITRKAACEQVLSWLPPERKNQFLVADRIAGFHPKAVFWKEKNGRSFAVVGSSNLTRAAFETNYEVNSYLALSSAEYRAARKWLRVIEAQSVPISEDWLSKYQEAPPPQASARRAKSGRNGNNDGSLIEFQLPKPAGADKIVVERREQLANYATHRDGLFRLFRRRAREQITDEDFYKQLPRYWGHEKGDRFQGYGWHISGRNSDFGALATSFLRIVNSPPEDRDNIVSEEIDKLAATKVPARRAFFSEMLCLRFPDLYPVLNKPIESFLKKERFRPARKASEGARYLDLAQKLRVALLQNPDHPAKNLAELDAVIWLEYGT